VVHGPLVMAETDDVQAHFAALRSGNHAIVGNNIIMNPVLPDGTIARRLAVTRGGIGVCMLSTHNRVTDNGIFHARTGVVVTAYNVVSDNVISPCVVAILAWAYNTVSGNSIGWFPHTAPGLPWELEVETATGALLLSAGNTCDGNSIVCGMDNPDEPDAPAAVHVQDWPGMLFGDAWEGYFNETAWGNLDASRNPLAAQLLGNLLGGNTIANHVIELSDPAGEAGEASAFFHVDGVVLNGDQVGNTLSGTMVWRGYRGIVVASGPAVISGCTAYLSRDHCLLLGEEPVGRFVAGEEIPSAQGSDVSGCIFYTTTGLPVRISEASSDLNINDCLVAQASNPGWSRSEAAARFVQTRPIAVDQRADRVSINDCAIVNFANAGIAWAGSFGTCGGCWFFTKDPDYGNTENDINSRIPRYPAIRFARSPNTTARESSGEYYFPDAATQGNLVWGAHMLNCSVLDMIKDDRSEEATGGIRDSSPIEWSNRFWMYDPTITASPEDAYFIWNPHPPGYDPVLDRWTNRVDVKSCYYWDWYRWLVPAPLA
jgi:hypothetical protein